MARQRRGFSASGELLEDPFRETVEQLAGFYGWLIYHTHDSRRSAPGFPDDVMVRGPELLFVEFKTDRGRLRPEQQVWLDVIREVESTVHWVGEMLRDRGVVHINGAAPGTDGYPTVEAHVWRPRDFDAVIHPRLARGRVRQEPIDSPVPPPAASNEPRRTP